MDYPASKNSWVNSEHCECDEKIREFEISRFHSIIGMQLSSNEIRYAIKLKCESNIQLIKSIDVFEKWPIQMLKFLEARLQFVMPPRAVHFEENIMHDIESIAGPPSTILGNICLVFRFINLNQFDKFTQ